jgi:hypothetical protein
MMGMMLLMMMVVEDESVSSVKDSWVFLSFRRA